MGFIGELCGVTYDWINLGFCWGLVLEEKNGINMGIMWGLDMIGINMGFSWGLMEGKNGIDMGIMWGYI